MGQELECTARYRERRLTGKAYLETGYLLFRGTDGEDRERVKVALQDLTSVTAAGGLLTLEFRGGPMAIELGEAAEKWAGKIRHPPSRAQKLGVKPGVEVRLAGEFEAAFLDELRGTVQAADGRAKADLVFFAAATARDLARVAKLTPCLKPAGPLWVIYPKGVEAIREIQVLEAGRAAGLKDTKVASFSPTHTALRFVVPLAER